jgi:uncharacterized membrane protein YccC
MAKAKDKEPKGAKKGKKGAEEDPQAARIVRLRSHPRARRHIAQAKGWGGLGGFAITLWMSLQAGAPAFDAMSRALMAGVGLYIVAWAFAIVVWRQIAVGEVRAAHRRIQEANERILAESLDAARAAEHLKAAAAA